MEIANRIRSLRKVAGLTQNDLAQRLYVTRQVVNMWERGQRVPDLETCERIAEVLKVDVSSLICEEDGQSVPRKAVFSPRGWILSCGIVLGIAAYNVGKPQYLQRQARTYQILPLQAFFWTLIPLVFWLSGRLIALILQCKFSFSVGKICRKIGWCLSAICAVTSFRLILACIIPVLEPLQTYSLWFLAFYYGWPRMIMTDIFPFLGGLFTIKGEK